MKRTMTLLMLLIITSLVAMPQLAGAENRDLVDCIQEEEERGTKCGLSTSLYVRMKNGCSRITAHVVFCLQKADGTYDCGSASLDPGESHETYVCNGTGEYVYGACSIRGDCRCIEGICQIR